MYEGFLPISTTEDTILIVGSMPSETSIAKGEYYGHRSNDFWPIIAKIWDVSFDSYADKVSTLHTRRVALWDVFATCTRERSKDSSIKNGEINNFSQFFIDHPHIRKVIANGKLAHRYFVSIAENELGIPCYYAPSTSRAYPMSLDKKVALWEPLLS
ncbi:MAG: DNA-deoxyinosine glycosylase [Sphaerochaetaceae bacterium]|nr:DNA-deoxyinosine glycosylase [Sphaerochaetaceae bacterium]